MFSSIWTSISGWKVKGIAVGYIAIILAEKVLGFNVPGFEVGADWLNQIFMAGGVFAARDTVTAVTGK